MFKDFKFNFKYAMAILALISCACVLCALVFVEIPAKNETLFNVLATLFFGSTIQKAGRYIWPEKEERAPKVAP